VIRDVVEAGTTVLYLDEADALADRVAVTLLVGVYILALTWVSVCIGIVASSPEGASGFSFAIMFLPYVSSAFVQPETMSRVFAVLLFRRRAS